MKINLRQDFMTSAMLVIAVLIEQFPDNRQLTLWSSCSDDQSTVGREEGTVQQTSPMAHTSSLRLVYRELTVRVIIFTAGSMHEQFHCARKVVPTTFHWQRSQSIPRHFSPEDHEVRRWYPRGNAHLRRVVGRHNHVPKFP